MAMMAVQSAPLRVLVIDDEPGIVDFVTLGLRYESCDVATAADGRAGLALALEQRFDVVILDLMLPGLDGMQVCRELRAAGRDVAIIMLTAKDEVTDRVAGLNEGADDYLTKPFKFEELLARLRAVLRRRQPQTASAPVSHPDGPLQFDTVQLDPTTREVRRDGRLIALTVREFDLLAYFLRHPRQVLTREAIMNAVWGYEYFGDGNIIEVYVRYLRQKLGDPNVIQTVRGVGYALKMPV